MNIETQFFRDSQQQAFKDFVHRLRKQNIIFQVFCSKIYKPGSVLKVLLFLESVIKLIICLYLVFMSNVLLINGG